jgi:hypothetical protein
MLSLPISLSVAQPPAPVEMHIYEQGKHGVGLGRETSAAGWPDRSSEWMAARGLLPKP